MRLINLLHRFQSYKGEILLLKPRNTLFILITLCFTICFTTGCEKLEQWKTIGDAKEFFSESNEDILEIDLNADLNAIQRKIVYPNIRIFGANCSLEKNEFYQCGNDKGKKSFIVVLKPKKICGWLGAEALEKCFPFLRNIIEIRTSQLSIFDTYEETQTKLRLLTGKMLLFNIDPGYGWNYFCRCKDQYILVLPDSSNRSIIDVFNAKGEGIELFLETQNLDEIKEFLKHTRFEFED